MITVTAAIAAAFGRGLLIALILTVIYSLFTHEFSQASSQSEDKRYLRLNGSDILEMKLETRTGANGDATLLRHLSEQRAETSTWREALYLYQAQRTDSLVQKLPEQGQAQLIKASYDRNPTNPLLLYRTLLRSIAKEKHKTAIGQSQQLSEMVPQFGPAARIAARLLQKVSSEEGKVVITLYHQALLGWQSHEDFWDSFLELFRTLRKQGQDNEIVRLHTELSDSDSYSFSPEHELIAAFSNLTLGQREQAYKLFKAVAQSEETADKTARQALFMQAIIREQQGRLTEALLVLTGSGTEARFRKAMPHESHQKARMIGYLAEKLEAKDIAPLYFTKALRILPDPSSTETLVTALSQSNAADKALDLLLSSTGQQDCWRKASDIQACMVQVTSSNEEEVTQGVMNRLLLSPEGRKQLLDIAHGLRRSNELESAVALYGQLAKTEPDQNTRKYYLKEKAITHAQAGQYDRAAHSYLNAHELSPDAQSWLKAVRAHHRIKDWKKLEKLFGEITEPQSVSRQIQALGCRTQAELGKLDSAFACYHGFAKRNPQAAHLIREGVSLADMHGQPEVALSLLELINSRKTPKDLLDLGYRYADIKLNEKAEANFQLAYRNGQLAEAGLAFALALLKRGRIALAESYFQEIQNAHSLSLQDQRLVVSSLAHIYAESENHKAAAHHWKEALRLGDSPEFRVKLSYSLLQLGQLEESWKHLELVESVDVSGGFKALFHDLQANHAFHRNEQETELIHRKYALDLEATAARYLSLANALKQSGQTKEALYYLRKAADAYPDNADFKVEQAYMHSRQGDDAQAAEVLEKALVHNPDYPGVRANLAFTYLRLGYTERAGEAFRRAMDEGNYSVLPETDTNGVTPRSVLQGQHRKLDRPYSLSLTNGFCFPRGMACRRLLNPFGDSHNLSYGQLAMKWRPLGGSHLHQWAHLFELTTRLFWSNNPGFSMMNSDSTQAAVGVRTYPLHGKNYWLGAERILPIGNDAISGWLLRAGFSESRGDNWRHSDHPFKFYGHTHSEVSRLFSKDDQTSAFSEGRAGLGWQASRKLMFLPFGYIRGGGQMTQSSERRRKEYAQENTRTVVSYPDTTGDVWIEGGIGLSARWRFNQDRYNGYLSQGETLLRLGRDLHTTWSNPATRFSLLFRITF